MNNDKLEIFLLASRRMKNHPRSFLFLFLHLTTRTWQRFLVRPIISVYISLSFMVRYTPPFIWTFSLRIFSLPYFFPP